MAQIAILHPGAMGAEVGRALVDNGHDVVFIPAGRSAETRRRAEDAGLRPVSDLAGCRLVISICPPAVAAQVATFAATGTAGAPRGSLFLDANAIAPSTADGIAGRIALAGLTYVDGGIVGPPPRSVGTTRLYLSGAEAPNVAELFRGARIEPRIVPDAGPTAASAVKMTYAAWSKISAALLLAADGAAGALGVQQALRAEWALSQPDLTDRLAGADDAATEKGWRWAAEMLEIAATFEQAGQPGAFGRAAAEIFGGFARPADDVSPDAPRATQPDPDRPPADDVAGRPDRPS